MAVVHAVAAPPQRRAEAAPERPNVLIIMTDDQRTNLSTMPKTREIFLQGGREYKNAFTAVPNCCPARATVMTGRYPHNHHVENNDDAYNLEQSTTLQHYLQDDAGYRTSIFGKYLNGWKAKSDAPPHFDEYAIHQPFSNMYYDSKYTVNGDTRSVDGYATDFLADKASRFIRDGEDADDTPWLMYVTPNAPHPPSQPKRSYRDANVPDWNGNAAVFEKNLNDKPRYVREQNVSFKEGNQFRKRQLRTLMAVDDMVAQIFKTMRRQGENSETIAIFTSDNGYMWGEHGISDKWVPYEDSVHIPLILRFPGQIPSGSRDNRLVVNADIAPTIVDALDIEIDGPDMDGKSLLDESWERSEILIEYGFQIAEVSPQVLEWSGLRSKDDVYTEYYKDDELRFREYYDLDADPWELKNLLRDGDPSNDAPAAARAAELAAVKDCAGTTCP